MSSLRTYTAFETGLSPGNREDARSRHLDGRKSKDDCGRLLIAAIICLAIATYKNDRGHATKQAGCRIQPCS